jgi:CubicO group peptidase (beta-lactamase class C family)
VFQYLSVVTDTLGWVIERACGASFASVLERHLWKPLGCADDAYVTLDPEGLARSAGGFCGTLRDLARFAEMIRTGGRANGRQIVPRAWIDDTLTQGDREAWRAGLFTDIFAEGSYRNSWIVPHGAGRLMCAVGVYGQSIYVDLDQELVAVRLSSQTDAIDMARHRVWFQACRTIGEVLNGRAAAPDRNDPARGDRPSEAVPEAAGCRPDIRDPIEPLS